MCNECVITHYTHLNAVEKNQFIFEKTVFWRYTLCNYTLLALNPSKY